MNVSFTKCMYKKDSGSILTNHVVVGTFLFLNLHWGWKFYELYFPLCNYGDLQLLIACKNLINIANKSICSGVTSSKVFPDQFLSSPWIKSLPLAPN